MPHNVTWVNENLPYSQEFEDTFYSNEDGRAETRHVFLCGNDLPDRWADADQFMIGELGFGTGLNFLETWHLWRQHRRPGQYLTFHSVEGFPLSQDTMARALSRWTELHTLSQVLIEHWEFVQEGFVDLDAQTRLRVYVNPVEAALAKLPGNINAWYLDGFSPARNPDMWSPQVCARLANLTAANGTLASYTSAGWVRRNLELAGFEISRVPGFGRKRHMITGQKEGGA